MSFEILNGNADLVGDLGAGNEISMPITMAIWVKRSATLWAETSEDCAFILGDASASNDNSHRISCCNGAADKVSAISDDGTSFVATQNWTSPSLDDVWIPLIGVFISNSNRWIYFDGDDYSDQNTSTASMGNSSRYIRIGNNLTTFLPFNAHVSDACIWDGELSAANIALLRSGASASETGPRPDSIDPTNVVGYWSLRADGSEPASWPDESGNGGPTLTMTGTDGVDYNWNNNASGNNPTITGGATVNTKTLIDVLAATDGSPIQ
jgi:hypothetical protein